MGTSFRAVGDQLSLHPVSTVVFTRVIYIEKVGNSHSKCSLFSNRFKAQDSTQVGEHLALLRQNEGKIRRFVFVRAIDGLSFKEGNVIEIEGGRLARLYPRGRKNGAELGIIATSDQIKVVGNSGVAPSKKAAAKVAAQVEDDETLAPGESLPF